MKYAFYCILVIIAAVTGCVSPTSSTGSQQTLAKASQPSLTAAPTSPSTYLQGSGNDLQTFTTEGYGTRIFTLDYQGKNNFTVVLEDNEGKTIEILADGIGPYNGIMASDPLIIGTYKLEVKASGPWTIDISEPNE